MVRRWCGVRSGILANRNGLVVETHCEQSLNMSLCLMCLIRFLFRILYILSLMKIDIQIAATTAYAER